MNRVFFAIIAAAYAFAAGQALFDGSTSAMEALARASLESAADGVKIAIGLIGILALFLGLMRVGERAGIVVAVARLLQPLMLRLFPRVPAGHPAMGAMIFNMSANVLGLGNAATPFGIRAMQQLHRLNRQQGETDPATATDAMVLFLAINTASITLLPTSVIALRAAAGSADPAGVLPTTLFATLCSTVTAILVARIGAKWWPAKPPGADARAALAAPGDGAMADEPDDAEAGTSTRVETGYPAAVGIAAAVAVVALIPLTILFGQQLAAWIIPTLIFGFLAYGMMRNIPVYAAFVDGAREGFDIAVKIIPYLVAILVAIAMLKASGAVDHLLMPLGRLTAPLGLPPEGLIMAVLRALSGSGAFAYLAALLNDPAIGPDSYTGYLVSTIQASTETTFYVIAVYFGAVGVIRFRHAVIAGLAADAVGLVASVVICRLLHGP
ncbi:MAG: spore maturation protein [Rhodospirillales bacterium]|nr:spore maturation protein [Rhodospirillales bacterium]